MKKVVAIEDWGWWFKPGETYTVQPYPHQATRGAKVNCCPCMECQVEVGGKELYDMYECVDQAHAGNIIPVIACRDAQAH